LDGHSTDFSLSDQVILAAWMFKTAIVLESARHPRTRFFSSRERRRFIETLEPQGNVWIWMAHHCGSIYAWELTNSTPSAFTATFAVGHVAFQIVATGRAKRLIVPNEWDRAAILIWPPSQPFARWPPAQYLDDDGLQEFAPRWTDFPAPNKHHPSPIVRSFDSGRDEK